MATSSARMRLTVEILPLEAENSHGPYQAAALAAFKGRKFALPVQLEDNFEQVWSQIEERYKRNYLTPLQAASFTIQKLQDAYDCDLDLSDTVSSIYEGETDLSKRTIKVVPSFIHRDFSVPFTSNLRPTTAQKRQRESYEDPTNKRRRLEEQQHALSVIDQSRDRPLPSTESERSGDDGAGLINTDTAQDSTRLSRSQSGGSVVISYDMQTGLEEFAPGVKEESPELGDPVMRPISESEKELSRSPDEIFKRPLVPASASKKAPRGRKVDRPRKESYQQAIPEFLKQNGLANPQEDNVEHNMEDVIMDDELSQHSLRTARSPESSNDPTPEVSEPAQNGGHVPRVSIYDPPGSPEFIGGSAKRLKTYGRFPRTPRLVQKQAPILNNSRTRSESQGSGSVSSKTQKRIKGKARAFQKPKLDEIESTPRGLSSPVRPAESSAEDPFVSNRSTKECDNPVDGSVFAKGTSENAIELPRNKAKPKHKPGKVSDLKRPTRIAYTMPTVPTTATISAVQSSTAAPETSSSMLIFNPFRATTPSIKPPEKIVPEHRSTVQDVASNTQKGEPSLVALASKSPKVGNGSSSKALRANSEAKDTIARAPDRRNSPKIVIPKQMQSLQAEFHSSHSQSVQRSPSHLPVGRTAIAEVASNLLNASRIPAQAKETTTSELASSPQGSENRLGASHLGDSRPKACDDCRKRKRRCRHDTNSLHNQPNSSSQPDHDVAMHSKPNIAATDKTPARTEVPLPDNVAHLAKASAATAEEGSTAVNHPETFKKPLAKAPEPLSGEKSNKNSVVQSVSESGDRKSTPIRTEVPFPDNVKHLASQRMSISKSPRRSITNSEVPLSDNVKHLNKPVEAGPVLPATPSNPKRARKISQPSSPPARSALGSTAEEPVEISSGESSSSDDSEEDEEIEEVVEETLVAQNVEGIKNANEKEAEEQEEEQEEEEEEEDEILESPVKSRTVKETSPVQSELDEARLEDANIATSGDAESMPDADEPQTFSEDGQASPEKDAALDTADSSEPPRSPVEISSAVDNKGNSSPHPIPWNAGSWGNGTIGQTVATDPKSDVEMADTTEPRSRSRSGSASTIESESKSVAHSNSRSASGVDSTRSSPAVSRRPARFLSHSPTPNNSSSEDESVAASTTPAKIVPSKLTNGKGDEADSDSSSSDSDNSSDESDQDIIESVAYKAEAGDSDVEMADATVDTRASDAASSPTPSPQKSRRQVPPASQPLPLKSGMPFPSSNLKVAVPSIVLPNALVVKPKLSSSQPNPQTPGTGPRRPTYQKFPSIKDQLSAARSTPASIQRTGGFDARTLNLSKLTKAKQQGKKGVVLNEDSSSDDSSCDDSSSEDEGTGKGAGCSVA